MNKKSISAVVGFSLVAGMFYGALQYSSLERGERFLDSKGYTNITGGERKFFSSCGRSLSRSFRAMDKKGEYKEVTVCFNPLIGPYRSPASLL